MIRSVRGTLIEIATDSVVVEVGGVGMLLRVSAQTARSLPALNSEIALAAHLVVREDALDLYGFATVDERRLFEAFIGVYGVGPRMALAICGVDAPDELRLAVARGDAAKIQRAQGVGKRTSERVVLELRDKVGDLVPDDSAEPRGITAADTFLQARDGLVGLGFRAEDADEALSDAPQDASVEELIRHGLGRLGR